MNSLRLYSRLLLACMVLLAVPQPSIAMGNSISSFFDRLFDSSNKYLCVVCNEDIRVKNLPVYQIPCSQHFVHMKCSKNINYECPSCSHIFGETEKKEAFNGKEAQRLMKFLKDTREDYQGKSKDDKGKGKARDRKLAQSKKNKSVIQKRWCAVCKDSKPRNTFIKFINCDHELCIGCMRDTLGSTIKKCSECPRQPILNQRTWQYDYTDRSLANNEIDLIRGQMRNLNDELAKTLPNPKHFDWCTGHCARYEEQDRNKLTKLPCNHTLCSLCLLNFNNCDTCPVVGCDQAVDSSTLQGLQYKLDKVTRKLVPWQPQLKNHDVFCTGHCRMNGDIIDKRFIDPSTGGFVITQKYCGHHACVPCGIRSPGCQLDKNHRLSCGHSVQAPCSSTPQCPHVQPHMFACGHVINTCSNLRQNRCPRIQQQTLPCGHQIQTCVQNLANVQCQFGRQRVLSCGIHYKHLCGRALTSAVLSKCMDGNCLRRELYKNTVIGSIGVAALGYTAYKGVQVWLYGKFNTIEYSVDELIRILIAPDEAYWDFDLYNIPFMISQLAVQHNVDQIVNSVNSQELQQQLATAIKNFDTAFLAVWHAIDKEGYYNKGKSAFMRDKKILVQAMQQRADELKNVLAECRAQASIWKKTLGITAVGVLGVGAWIYSTLP